MKAEHYFLEIGRSIKNISSKADLILFDGTIKKSDKDEITEDCLTLACLYMASFKQRPPFLLDFLEKENTVEKLSKEQRKQFGAFFTPPCISEYIAKETVGPLVDKIKEDKRVKDKIAKICRLKICDPAMGGAIFLVSAHDFLMTELLSIEQEEYSIEDMAKMSLKTLYGVDINPLAVEFSKMVLNLNGLKWKLMETIDEYALSVERNTF